MTLAPTHDQVLAAVRTAVGRPAAEVADWTATPACRADNFTTDSLQVVEGRLEDGTAWSLFLKVLRPASAAPAWSHIPEAARAQVLRELDWLDEPRVYRSALADDLPPGLRLPRLVALEEAGDRLLLWLERVRPHGHWDAAAYARAASLLGRLSGRWPESRVRDELGLRRRDLSEVLEGPVRQALLPALADDATWAHPALRGDDRLRRDLDLLAAEAGGLVDRVRELPHALAHGDACPANLLWERDGGLVALDWSYGSSGALGSDLGQLLGGRALTGELDASHLPGLVEVVVAAHVEGLAAEGVAADSGEVRLALVVHLLVRSGFWALALDRPDLPASERDRLLGRRARVAGVCADLALQQLVRA